jgi:hypothetical protein
MRFARNATVTEDPRAVLGMADLISEEDTVILDTAIMDTAIMDTVIGDLISVEIYFSSGISDCRVNMYCEYVIKRADQQLILLFKCSWNSALCTKKVLQ